MSRIYYYKLIADNGGAHRWPLAITGNLQAEDPQQGRKGLAGFWFCR